MKLFTWVKQKIQVQIALIFFVAVLLASSINFVLGTRATTSALEKGSQAELLNGVNQGAGEISFGLGLAEVEPLTVAFFVVTLIVVVGLGVWIIGQMIVKPLQRLQVNAGKVAGGNFDVAVSVNKQDEIGKLSVSFNEMVQTIKKNMGHVNTIIDLTVQMSREGDLDNLLKTFLEKAREITH